MYTNADRSRAIFERDRKSRSPSGVALRSRVPTDIFTVANLSERVRRNEGGVLVERESTARIAEGGMKRRGICCGRKSGGES